MNFDYQRDTRDHYKSPDVALRYHVAYSGKGWRTEQIRARWVARRERSLVLRLLRRVPHARVLDIPAGTGKMAPIFRELRSSVVACDISESMLHIAREEYRLLKYPDVHFIVADAENITDVVGKARFDTAVCLRLLHRVPADVKCRVLEQLSKAAKYVVVSFGTDSPYHRFRREMRSRVLGGARGSSVTLEPISSIREKIDRYFGVMCQTWVSPWVSQEVIFLLQSNK